MRKKERKKERKNILMDIWLVVTVVNPSSIILGLDAWKSYIYIYISLCTCILNVFLHVLSNTNNF